MAQTPKDWDLNPSALRERASVVIFAIAAVAFSASTNQVYIPIILAAAAILTAIGSERRWKSKPWLVFACAGLFGPIAGVGLMRELIKMALGGDFEFRIVCEIACALFATGAAMDEALASFQYVRDLGRAGRSPWRAFWGLSPRARKRGAAIIT